MVPFRFRLEARSGRARAGTFETPHGAVHTPAFMVVGTQGAVRAVTPTQIRGTGTEVLLANTYHLWVRPGERTVERLGGLHGFMRWDGPILTDSGGFQVYSLPHKEIGENGVTFRNHVDGSRMELTPERSIEVQNALGADVIMALDECTPHPADEKLARDGVRRTLAWAERCVRAHARPKDQALFGIVQGSVYPELRAECAARLVELDLPGYAIGGVSVGEGHEIMSRTARETAAHLPEDRPRYLMGVGLPEDLLAAVGHGIDLFDCVIPTRYARAATVFTSRGKLRLTNRRYRRDSYPIDLSCDCETCASGFARAYLHHLFHSKEIVAATLAAIHNIRFYQRLVHGAREAVLEDRYAEFAREFKAREAAA